MWLKSTTKISTPLNVARQQEKFMVVVLTFPQPSESILYAQLDPNISPLKGPKKGRPVMLFQAIVGSINVAGVAGGHLPVRDDLETIVTCGVNRAFEDYHDINEYIFINNCFLNPILPLNTTNICSYRPNSAASTTVHRM